MASEPGTGIGHPIDEEIHIRPSGTGFLYQGRRLKGGREIGGDGRGCFAQDLRQRKAREGVIAELNAMGESRWPAPAAASCEWHVDLQKLHDVVKKTFMRYPALGGI